MHKTIALLFILACCLAPCLTDRAPASDGRQARFLFGTAIPPGTFPLSLQQMVLQEAFRRNGWELEIRHYSGNAEVVELVGAGKLDGEPLRAVTYTDNDAHPEYVKIDVTTVAGELGIYAAGDMDVPDWASLAALDVTVGYTQGEDIIEIPLKEHLAPGRAVSFETRIQGFRALAKGRIDALAMVNHYNFLALRRMPEFRDSNVRRVAVITRMDGCAYFARKHADLVPVLERSLAAIKMDGTFDRFLEECMAKGCGPVR